LENWLPTVIPKLNDDAIFWVTYPKQSSKVKTDINRDSLAEIVQDISTYRPVSAVAVDDKWSAMRLREKDKVKSKK
jgi:agmatine/peptidylarginine deiminase